MEVWLYIWVGLNWGHGYKVGGLIGCSYKRWVVGGAGKSYCPMSPPMSLQRKRLYWRMDCKCITLFQNNTTNRYYKVPLLCQLATSSFSGLCFHVAATRRPPLPIS